MASMPRSEMMKPSSMPLRTQKHNYLLGLIYDVVDVGLNGPPDEVPEAVEHTALV